MWGEESQVNIGYLSYNISKKTLQKTLQEQDEAFETKSENMS